MSEETPPPFRYRAPSKVHYMDEEYQKKVGPDGGAWAGPEEGPAAGQVVKTFLSERLSAHAIPRIFKSPTTVRQVAWTLVSLVFLGLLIWQVATTVSSFLTFPKTTSVEMSDHTRIHFPAVTVCSMNPLVRSRARNTRWKSAADLEDTDPEEDFSSSPQESASSRLISARKRRKREVISTTETPSETTTYASPTADFTTTSGYDYGTTAEGSGSIVEGSGTTDGATTAEGSGSIVEGSGTTEGATTAEGSGSIEGSGTTEGATTAEGSGSIEGSGTTEGGTTEETTMAGTTTDAAITSELTSEETTTVESTTAADTSEEATSEWMTTQSSEATTTYNVTYSSTISYSSTTAVYDDPSYQNDMEDNLQEQFYGASLDNFTTVLQAMNTIDGSEVSDVFTPSRQEILEAGVRPEDFISSCSFDGEACNYTDFLQWQNGVYGNCFTFNSVFFDTSNYTDLSGEEGMERVKTTTHYGARHGLRLMLSPDLAEYIPAVTPEMGVRVSVHHPRTVPFPEDTGLNAAVNMRTSVRVRMKEVQRVKEPYGKCTSDEDWNRNYVGAYSSEGCVNVCLEERIRERCECIRMLNTIISDDHDDMVRCNPTNQTQDQCVALVRVRFLHDIEPCVCLNPCYERLYTTAISFNGDNANFSDILAPLKDARMPMDPVKIHIYMESLSASVVKEAPAFTPFTLVSNIGGSFGLFVGLSLVTVVEILEFLFDFCVMMVPRTRRAHAARTNVAPAA